MLMVAGLCWVAEPALSQDQTLELSRQQTLKMLTELDSLVTEYAASCSFMGDPLTATEERARFLSLFESDSVEVFDDINPNIDPSAVERINEQNKTVDNYIWGILREFNSYDTYVTRTNVASAAERMYRKDSNLYTTVSVRKRSLGALKDTLKCKTVNTDANLELWIRIYDTVQFNMKIARISKEGPLGVDWNYTYAKLKRKKMETHFNLKPVYSQLVPSGFVQVDPPNKIVVNHNAFLESEHISDLGLTSKYLGGSYGINGEVEFRFFKKNEEKNRTSGFSLGVGGGLYNSFFQAERYTDVLYHTDKDGDLFYEFTHVDDLRESWMMFSADIPLKYSSEKWKSFEKGRYFKLGVRLSYMMGTGKAEGILTRSGYYPKYGVTIEEVEEYGFVTDQPLNERMDLDINPYNVAVELSAGRKRRSKSGKAIWYIGFNIGAYGLDVIGNNAENLYAAPEDHSQNREYQGILPMMTAAHLGYVGIEVGILKANPNEELLKRKKIIRLEGNGAGPESGYRRTYIQGLDSRDFSSSYAILIDELPKKDRPEIFKVEDKDPRKELDKYIREELVLSEAEIDRISNEKEYIVHFSFIVDRDGLIQDIKLKNQNETEFGQELYLILSRTSAFWDAGIFNGSPVDTKIEMSYKY